MTHVKISVFPFAPFFEKLAGICREPGFLFRLRPPGSKNKTPEACVSASEKAQHWTLALRFFEDLQRNVQADVISYSAAVAAWQTGAWNLDGPTPVNIRFDPTTQIGLNMGGEFTENPEKIGS